MRVLDCRVEWLLGRGSRLGRMEGGVSLCHRHDCGGSTGSVNKWVTHCHMDRRDEN